MNGADLLEDGVPHGTTAGYDAGCRSMGGCPGKDGPWAQTCMTAKSRSRMEFGYGKAVAKGREVELLECEVADRTAQPIVPAKVARAKKSQLKHQGVPAVAEVPVSEEVAEEPELTAPTPAPAIAADPDAVEQMPVTEEEPRPRGKRVLDDAVRTLAESLELQRALAVIGERALRTIRIEINHLRRESAAQQNQQEK